MKNILLIVLFSIVPKVVFPQTSGNPGLQPAGLKGFGPVSNPIWMFRQKPSFVQGGYKKTHIIPLDFHTKHFGFFCRQELKMHQASIPVTFRLGSMEQCNRLEGKAGCR